MVKTNIQTFTGEVEVLEEFYVGSNLVANDVATHVLTVNNPANDAKIKSDFFVGDGGLLSNIATTLQAITDQGNASSNVLIFNSNTDVTGYKNVGFVTTSNVGIQNTAPTHTLSIGDKVFFSNNTNEALGQSVMVVEGRINATRFQGDGGLLSNIATTLESIADQGNASSNVLIFNSNVDIPGYKGIGFVTTSNVGIQNTNPGFNTLSVGSNLFVNIYGSNVLTVHGNAAVSNLLLSEFTVSPAHGLQDVTLTGRHSTQTVQLTNTTTGLEVTSNINVAGEVIITDATRGLDVTSNIELGGRLKFDTNVFVDTLRVADMAANIVTYDRTTGELLDSSGTFMNKFAVVSEQPPSDLFANTTTVTNHGGYTLTTSNLATNSNTYNAFDGTANAWVSGGLAGGYIGGSNVFLDTNLTQLSNLHPTRFGDWLAIEFPYKTTLRHMKLTPLTAAQFPSRANVYATNDNHTWSEVKYWGSATDTSLDLNPVTDSNVQTIVVNATEQFKKYALVATKAAGNSSNVAIQDWQLFTESFSIDGGKVAMTQQAATGGETVMDQSGPHGRLPNSQPIVEHPRVIGGFTGRAENNRKATGGGEAPVSDHASQYAGRHMSSNIYTKAGYTVSASTVYNSGTGNFDVARLYDHHDDHNTGLYYCSGGTTGAGVSYSSTSGLYRDTITSGTGIDGKTSPFTGYAGTAITTTVSGTSIAGEWLGIETPDPIILKYVKMVAEAHATYFHATPHKGVFAGSHDGVTWESVSTFNNFMAGSDGTTRPTGSTTNMYIGPHILEVNSTKAYKYHRMIVEAIQGTYGTGGGAGAYLILDDLKWYGCNEDPPVGDTSVDTTFTSVMNTPQTTGANVYVDGSLGGNANLNRVVGPAAANTAATYNETGKYWTLNGQLTSNITVEANTFLSGDQPHAVSMWFNSSNLESNVSNSCIVSVGTENKIDHIGSAFTSNYQTVKKITADEEGRNSRSTTNSNFGGAVAINSDGTRMIVGALNEDLTSGDYGAVYIYTYSNGSWDNGFRIGRNGESYPSGGDGGSGDQKFGRSVDINDAGTKVIVGAERRDGGGTNQGAAYIYEYSNGQWNLEGFVTASNAQDDDRFGYGVAMSGDGTKIAVGAILEDTTNSDSGAVYIYTYSGGSWGSEVILRAHDAAQSGAGDAHLGYYVAMNGDGTKVVAGAPFHDLNASDAATTDAGAAYVFAYDGSTWSEEAKIQASDIAASDYFGYNVDINSDGTKIVVGAKGQDTGGSLAGAAYVYTYSGGSWGSEQKIQASDKRLNNEFGWAVDFNTDGTKLIVGAIYHDGGPPIGDKPVNNSGAAYVFEYDGSNWNEVRILKAFDPVLSDHFGAAVGMSGDGKRVVVGAQNDDDAPGSASGSIYVYDRDTIHHCTPEFQLESNTWHNLTYTYEGRGGSRVTYLDGHKVSEDVSGDTYGPYPPFPMSNYFESGYRASASEEYSSDYAAWEAFDSNVNSAVGTGYWSTLAGGYSTSWGLDQHAYGRAGEGTLVEGTRYKGAWLQLEMPHRLKVDVVRWQPRATTGMPYAGIVAGSNDGVKWYKIYEFDAISNPPDINAPGVPLLPSGSVSRIGYKYVRIITTKGGGNQYISAQQVKIYGTKESDIVRFPEPNRVLRYPHVELTDGPSKRGYRVTVSSEYGPRNERMGWMAFNDNLSVPGGIWQQNESPNRYTPGTGLPTNDCAVFPPGGTTKGEWIKLELPHKIKVSSIFMITASGHEAVEKAILYGSNDDTNWDVVKSEFTTTLTAIGSYRHTTESVTTSNYYKYLVLQVTKCDATGGGSNGRSLQIYRLHYFGVEEGSVPIQIGGGNIDKVANFRVYNKFIDEDQALEIWDSQKDEFGRAKSSMTLHKGRIGLGTTEPEGRLAVLDEPHNLEEFPPRAMTRYKNYFDGHGEFCVSAATAYADYQPYRVFDRGLADGTGIFGQQVWHNALGNQEFTNTRPGLYIGQDRLGGYRGLWLKLELPYKIQPFYVDITPRGYSSGYAPNYDQNPKDFKILASNDDVNWDVLTNQTGVVFGGGPKRFDILSSKNYRYLAFIGTKTVSGAYMAIREMRYLGIREQGQSVLQDGQLTLTKSLNVPQIGPALDVDNTPRRDRLMLEYNTTTNPTFERCIRDTSGNGLDAVLYRDSQVVYDAYDKSFKNFSDGGFESMTRDNLLPTNGTHTFSAWVRFDQSTNWYAVYGIGGNVAFSGNNSITVYIGTTGTQGRFRLEARGGSYRDFNYTFKHGMWVHMAIVYDGTGGFDNFHIYMDKVKLGLGSASSNGTSAIALPAKNQTVRFGQSAERDPTQPPGSYHKGRLSSIKVYDTNLTYEEICTLYDMGRCDDSNHMVNFSKTRVGIGLADGASPKGALDVRGDLYVNNNFVPGRFVGFSVYRSSNNTAGDPVVWNGVWARSQEFEDLPNSSGFYRIPYTGKYLFTFYGIFTSGVSMSVYKNSSASESGATFTRHVPYDDKGSGDGSWIQLNGSGIEDYAAGEYIFVTTSTVMYGNASNPHNGFSLTFLGA